jgi:predicted nuclease of predicted toxin-antitoxin system
MANLLGGPPKAIWLRAGNQPTEAISTLLRRHSDLILAFANDDDAACLDIDPPPKTPDRLEARL